MIGAFNAIEKVHPKEGHGFEATREITVGKGAPTVTAMWRDPR